MTEHRGIHNNLRKMFRNVICVFLLISGINAFNRVRPKIVGGQNAYLGQFKHQVYLTTNTGFFCGGSIIAPNKILTAAHCVCLDSKNITVVAGTNTLMSGGQRRAVKYIHCNTFSTLKPTLYDLAVLTLDTNLTYSSLVNEIKLATESPIDGENIIVSGWGLLSYPGNVPNALQYVMMKALDIGVCAKLLPAKAFIDEGHVCTIAPVGKGVCKGDSGSPLINSKGLQVGIVSWGIPCAKGKPEVSTNVAKYHDWITSIK